MRTLLAAAAVSAVLLPLGKVIVAPATATTCGPAICADGIDEPVPAPYPKRA
jgi:hypothetical protein